MKMQMAQQRVFQSLSEFWQARNSRERQLLTLGMVFLLLALIYAVLIDPAISARAQLSKSLPQLRQQAAEMQALAKEAASLPQRSAQTVQPVTRDSVAASLGNHGLTPQNLTVSGEIVRVQLSNASFANVVGWLGTARSAALLEVTEANIVALSQPDMVNATLTLRQQARE